MNSVFDRVFFSIKGRTAGNQPFIFSFPSLPHVAILLVFLVLLPLFSQLAFSASSSSSTSGTCIGYTDSFDVRVLDALLRPVPNASVTVKYDRGASFGSQYFTTPAQLTNSNGMLHFDIYNQGTLTRDIDCDIIITATIGGSSNKTTVTANAHANPIDLKVSRVYPVQFLVRDQLGAPLPDVTIAIGNFTAVTNAQGNALFTLKQGNYTYFATLMDGKQEGQVTVAGDSVSVVTFPRYAISISVSDDFGNPLPASLSILNSSYQINGRFEKTQVFGSSIPYSLEYNGLVREGTIIPSENPDIGVVYDLHAPVFGNLTSTVKDGRYRLKVPILDQGTSASGVLPSSFSVTYRLEPADPATPWTSAITFASGRTEYTAEFQELPPNRIVQFRLEVKDNEGNKASQDGRFSTLLSNQSGSPDTPNNPNNPGNPNNVQNSSQTNTNTPSQPGSSQEIPPIYIIICVFVAILIVYVLFRIKSNPQAGT